MATSVFAVPDVPADEPIHGIGAFHVLLNLANGPLLVFGFRKRKGGLKFVLPGGIPRIGVPFQGVPGRLRFQQAGRQIIHGFPGGAGFAPPAASAQGMQIRRFLADADITAQQLRLRYRHVQLGALRIFDGQRLLALMVKIDFIKSQVFADAVLHVNDEVSRLNIAPVRQRGPLPLQPPRSLLQPPMPAQRTMAVEIAFRQHGQPPCVTPESGGQGADVDPQGLACARRLQIDLAKTVVGPL